MGTASISRFSLLLFLLASAFAVVVESLEWSGWSDDAPCPETQCGRTGTKAQSRTCNVEVARGKREVSPCEDNATATRQVSCGPGPCLVGCYLLVEGSGQCGDFLGEVTDLELHYATPATCAGLCAALGHPYSGLRDFDAEERNGCRCGGEEPPSGCLAPDGGLCQHPCKGNRNILGCPMNETDAVAVYSRAVDGGWSEWQGPKCSSACGSQTAQSVVKTRTCSDPVPNNGGSDCEGPPSKTVQCNAEKCPGQAEGGLLYQKFLVSSDSWQAHQQDLSSQANSRVECLSSCFNDEWCAGASFSPGGGGVGGCQSVRRGAMKHLNETDEGASPSVSAFFPAGSTVGPFDTTCFSPGSRLKQQARLYSSPIKNVYDPLICQAFCKKDPDCHYFESTQRGECWLLAADGADTPNGFNWSEYISGPKACPRCFSYMSSSSAVRLTDYVATSFPACRRMCTAQTESREDPVFWQRQLECLAVLYDAFGRCMLYARTAALGTAERSITICWPAECTENN